MALQKNIFSFIIFILSIVSCCISLRDDLLDNYLQEESGYDFQAYPSYFCPVEGIKLHNSAKIETEYSDFKKSRILAASAKTINVQMFGAKGDGRTDDSKVIIPYLFL